MLGLQRTAGNRAATAVGRSLQRQTVGQEPPAAEPAVELSGDLIPEVDLSEQMGCDATATADDAPTQTGTGEGEEGGAAAADSTTFRLKLATAYQIAADAPQPSNDDGELEEVFGTAHGRIVGSEDVQVDVLKDGTVSLSATVPVKLSYGLWDMGRTDVEDADSEPVTRGSWQEVASDLTPDESGQPPRRTYWSRALTEKHERFHLSEVRDAIEHYVHQLFVPELDGKRFPKTTFNDDVRSALGGLEGGVKEHLAAEYEPGKEQRAYADGKPAYQELVAEVRERATEEQWDQPPEP